MSNTSPHADYSTLTLHDGIVERLFPIGTVLQLRFVSGPGQLENTVAAPVVDAATCCLHRDAATDNTVHVCLFCIPMVLDLHVLESFQTPQPVRVLPSPAAAALHDLTMGW